MKHISKQSEVLGINSNHNEFKKAVLRLTLYYTAGVFIILSLFSFLIYGLFVTRYDRTFHEGVHSENAETIGDEIKENLLHILIVSDLTLLVIAVFVSYGLSRKTLSPLEEVYQKQKRFIANAAHELRTPLAVLKAGGQLIAEKERSSDEYKKFVHESLEEVGRLIDLSNDLLFLAQNTSHSIGDVQLFYLSETCLKQCLHIAPYAEMKSNVVESDIAPDISLRGKQSDIERLILNLLKNAIDYNHAQGTVLVTLVKKSGKAVLSVQDSGIGISSKDLPYIFERFYKADTARTYNKNSGTGLGLAIVSDIVREHGATIAVESELGKGSRFEVTFPLV